MVKVFDDLAFCISSRVENFDKGEEKGSPDPALPGDAGSGERVTMLKS
jgi:hypothetical protein